MCFVFFLFFFFPGVKFETGFVCCRVICLFECFFVFCFIIFFNIIF